MNDVAEHGKKSSDALTGWRFWLMVIVAGLIGKFFGLLGGAIFLGLWWLVEWIWRSRDTESARAPSAASEEPAMSSEQRAVAKTNRPLGVDSPSVRSAPDAPDQFDERGALAKIAEEIARQQVDNALWLKALMEAQGDAGKQAYWYARLRLAEEVDKHAKSVAERLRQVEEARAAASAREAERDEKKQRDGPAITALKTRLASGEELPEDELNMIVALTVRHGHDLAEPLTPQRETLLHIAAKKHFWRAAEALIRQGAPLNATDASGRTPLQVAERNEAHIVVSMLMDAQSAHSNARQHLKNPVNAFEYCRQHGIEYSRVEELISAGKLPAYRSPKVLLVEGATAELEVS